MGGRFGKVFLEQGKVNAEFCGIKTCGRFGNFEDRI
jgi:hypothetical protein